MKSLLIAALLALPVAATAQTAPSPAPAPSPVPTAAARLTLDTPIQDIVADAQGKTVLDKDLPGLIELPQYDMFKSLTLKQAQGFSNGKLTDEMLAKTAADLAMVK